MKAYMSRNKQSHCKYADQDAGQSTNVYFQLPKFLFEGELRTGLTNDARILYALLLERYRQTQAKHAPHQEKEAYIICTREEMASMMQCSLPTVRKALGLLKEHQLVREESSGYHTANRIYLVQNPQQNGGIQTSGKNLSLCTQLEKTSCPEAEESPEKSPSNMGQKGCSESENKTSSNLFSSLNRKKFSPYINNKNKIKKEKYNISSISYSEEKMFPLGKNVEQQIEYEKLQKTVSNPSLLQAILAVFRSVFQSDKPFFSVSKTQIPAKAVRARLRELTHSHIQYVCDCITSKARHIYYLPAYLLTCLYRAPETYAITQAAPVSVHWCGWHSQDTEDHKPTYDLDAFEAMDFHAEWEEAPV